MNTEIIKIIEGGLKRDRSKVIKFARLLSENLVGTENNSLSKRIKTLLNGTHGASLVTADSLSPVPVDSESRLDVVEVTYPIEDQATLIFNPNVKKQLQNFVNGVRQKEKILKYGVDVQNSLLLYGPPGCGKTSAAIHIANELELPLVTARLDSMVSSLLGSTAKNIKKVFSYANDKPCILFLDEFDAIAKARDDSHELGELKRVVNSLLQNIDTFIGNNTLIAATNHHELLDNAVWRRFSETIYIGSPSVDERIELIVLYLKDYPTNFIDDNRKIQTLVDLSDGLSPSDIKNLCSTAIKNNLVNGSELLTYPEFLYEAFCWKADKDLSVESAVKYLSANGVTQVSIQKLLELPIRKVRKILTD
jgi:SpoVK/Ycf46/Vps4 family AAA+-type ATPase